MHRLLLVPIMAMALTSCEIDPVKEHTEKVFETPVESEDLGYPANNTGVNVRDKGLSTATPLDQSEQYADRVLTQAIRQMLIEDKDLSTNAKNIKVITNDGVVILRGPVNNESEKVIIEEKVQQISGIRSVDNLLEVIEDANE